MKIIIPLILLFSVHLCSAQKYIHDTTYFDVHWKVSTKSNCQYYQVILPDAVTMAPLPLLRVTCYYRSGVKQMIGYVLANDTAKRIGMYTYFEERGRPKSIYLYDYKNSIKYFINTGSYFKKIEPCDSNADVDLGISLYLDGHLKHTGYYLSGNDLNTSNARKMCTWKRYNPYTEKIAEVTDYDHGVVNGRHFRYHGNGKLWREEYYKEGKKTGIWKKYWYTGALRRKIVIRKTV